MGDRDDQAGRGGGTEPPFYYRGNRLGMPRTGPGSIPGFGRRFVGVLIDWLLSLALARLFVDDLTAVANAALVIFALENVVLLTLIGTTVGKRLVGIRVAATGERQLFYPLAVLVRTILLCLVIPAVIYDRDERGLHDRAAGTVTQRI
ncbi:RDD family protein [Salinactinospora qingdaonensis]|uniref:RDD family protein n=1 Tax=Salinactinospora qingdaonensis TaxID=702744 RepID=A0ABP7FEB3_9ACTN